MQIVAWLMTLLTLSEEAETPTHRNSLTHMHARQRSQSITPQTPFFASWRPGFVNEYSSVLLARNGMLPPDERGTTVGCIHAGCLAAACSAGWERACGQQRLVKSLGTVCKSTLHTTPPPTHTQAIEVPIPVPAQGIQELLEWQASLHQYTHTCAHTHIPPPPHTHTDNRGAHPGARPRHPGAA